MRRTVLALLCLCLTTPAQAGVEEAIDAHILPGYRNFAAAGAALSDAAEADCTAEALKPAYNAAFDAWIGISHIRFGPIEEQGRALSIAFWPDAKGFTGKAIGQLMASEDPVIDTPEGFAQVSVAAHGFFALERMLYDPALSGYADGSYACHLTRAMARHIAMTGADVAREWQDGYADTLRNAGAEGNTVFLSQTEAAQALFTSVVTGIEFIDDKRLGRPLGSFEKPRPMRAEARRSARSLRNITLSLAALRDLSEQLADGQAPETLKAFDTALDWAGSMDDQTLAGVAHPTRRFAVENLQQFVLLILEAAQAELGAHLNVGAGFNALDGD